jgi:hypothetical protein
LAVEVFEKRVAARLPLAKPALKDLARSRLEQYSAKQQSKGRAFMNEEYVGWLHAVAESRTDICAAESKSDRRALMQNAKIVTAENYPLDCLVSGFSGLFDRSRTSHRNEFALTNIVFKDALFACMRSSYKSSSKRLAEQPRPRLLSMTR